MVGMNEKGALGICFFLFYFGFFVLFWLGLVLVLVFIDSEAWILISISFEERNNPQRDLEGSSVGEVFCFALTQGWEFSLFKTCFIQIANAKGRTTRRDKTPRRQERWLKTQEHLLLLQKTGIWIPAHISSSSQLPETPASWDLSMLPSRFHEHLHIHTHTNMHTHMKNKY